MSLMPEMEAGYCTFCGSFDFQGYKRIVCGNCDLLMHKNKPEKINRLEAENAFLKTELGERDSRIDRMDSKINYFKDKAARLKQREVELVEALEDLVSQVKHLEYPATALDLDQARAVLAKGGE